MRLLDLHLRAYGPFTDRRLDLSGGREGLHLVFGLNEAGSSLALRALRALLYGIPERSQDAFRHDNAELRVGGRLRGTGGQELVCYRRKGRKNTLLDGDDRPIAEDTLTRLLGGVDEPLFERLFGIDHQSLVSGGQALLAERGREAEALFGSGLGSPQVHEVLERLDREAQELFAPRASKPLVNQALRRLGELQQCQREASLSARHWDEARKALSRAERRLAELDQELEAAARRRGALERIRRTLPGLAKRAGLRARLAELAQVPLLPEDFGQRRGAAQSRRGLAEDRRIKATARLADLGAKAAALAVSEDLLAEAEAIDDLREQLGSHRKAARDRPALVASATAQEGQAAQRLAALRPGLRLDEVEGLRPLLGRRRRATELGGRREALESAVKTARATLAEAEQTLTARREALQALPETPPLEGLQTAVEAAHRAGDLDRASDEAGERLGRHEDSCARDLAALGLWTGDLAALRQAALPGPESVRRFVADLQALDDAQRRGTEDRGQAEAERLRTQESLRALQLGGAVPTEEALGEARAHRDQGWQLVRRAWLRGEDLSAEAADYGAGTDLPKAFESAVTAADAVADRLRREAQRVHEQAAARARLESQGQAIDRLAADLDALGERRRALAEDWRQLWAPCPLSPLPPREMADWLGGATLLREKAAAGDELRGQLETLRGRRAAHRQALRAALTALAEPELSNAPDGTRHEALAPILTPILTQAESRLRALQLTRDRRRDLQGTIADLETQARRLRLQVETAQGELDGWRADWATLMAGLGLPAEASPAEVSDDLQGIAEILGLVDEAAALRARVAGIDGDARRFEAAAHALLGRLAPDLLEGPVAEAVTRLHQRLGAQREAKSRLDELKTQAAQAEGEIGEAEASLRAADQTLAEPCRQAGCDHPDGLPAAEERSRERRQSEADLRAIESELIEGGDGLDLDALEAEARAADRDTVLQGLTAVTGRIERELRPEREGQLEAKLNAERDFSAMAGGDQASSLAEEAEQTLAALRAHAERYMRVRLAGRVLRDTIEQFRRQHRDPILAGASGYFVQLTCGSFAAVETDFDEADQPVLVGVRPGGERLRVEAMSTGTRDQLYLALRLATLDQDLAGPEPLPFVVDDILIQFDDRRAQATLEALADFSARTQVILFTHHARVVEQARAVPGAEGRVFVHELG